MPEGGRLAVASRRFNFSQNSSAGCPTPGSVQSSYLPLPGTWRDIRLTAVCPLPALATHFEGAGIVRV
jgi:hypothetical protein